MAYYIDFTKVTLEKFRERVLSENLIPSQMIIRENLDERLEILKQHGLNNIAEVQKVVKTKKDVERLSQEINIPFDYLTVLRRIINSYHPKARKIKAFVGISDEVKAKLESIGIKTTVDLYEKMISFDDPLETLNLVDISKEELLKLMKLSDLCRIRYVNEAFAVLLYEAGYRSVTAVSSANGSVLFSKIKKVNGQQKIYGGNVGEKDMCFIIEDAKYLSIDVDLEK